MVLFSDINDKVRVSFTWYNTIKKTFVLEKRYIYDMIMTYGGDEMDVGVKIKVIRRKSLLSQSDFAKELGVSFSAVNRWENGKCLPNYHALKKMKEFCEKHNILFDIDEVIWEEP